MTDAIAAEWARSKRRRATAYAILTLAVTIGALLIGTRPTLLKLRSGQWPTTAAEIDQIDKVYDADGKGDLVFGRRIRLRFTYTTPDGIERMARQEISGAAATALGISPQGYRIFGTAPTAITAFYDPANPGVAVIDRRIGRGDVSALFPLLTLALGLLFTVTEWRKQRVAGDRERRAISRNEDRWQVADGFATLSVSPRPAFEPASMLAEVLCAMPVGMVYVSPHPVTLGGPITIRIMPRVARWGRRRLQVSVMLGDFNNSGNARHARWSQPVFDGLVARDRTVAVQVVLPRAADLPASARDCWVRLRWRTVVGLPWSRPMWLSIDATG